MDKLQAFKKAYFELLEEIDNYTDEELEQFSVNYPFEKSFDEYQLGIMDWGKSEDFKYRVYYGYANGFYEMVESYLPQEGRLFTYREAVEGANAIKKRKDVAWTQIVEVDTED